MLVTLSESNLQENPFNTAEGQAPVSVTENFWARMAREGRWRSSASNTGLDIPSDGTTYLYGPYITASKGCRLYPKLVVASVTVASQVWISVSTNVADDPGINIMAWLTPGQPLIIPFNGDVFCEEDAQVAINARTSTAGGKLYASVYGVEVTPGA